ncbi:MAG: hypothetical protein ACJ8M1_12530 [Chthoniobacterales bacterium]
MTFGKEIVVLVCLSVCLPALLTAATIYQTGFEAGTLGPEWSTSTTNDGRVSITSDFAPAAGTKHLVLDDTVNDAIKSVAEATLTLNLSDKKNVVLSFQAKSLQNEPDEPPTTNFTSTRTYDGVAISTDGGGTWRSVQSLANVSTSWQSFSITLDAAVLQLGGSFGPGFRVRFSEYDNAPAPIDGIAFDEITVTADDDRRVTIELPNPVLEGSGVHTGNIAVNFAPASPMTFDTAASPGGQVLLPATVTIPAGQTFAIFDFSVPDDSTVNLTRTVSISASASGVTSIPATLTIYDDEAPFPTLSLPAQLTEGATPTNNAILTISHAATKALTLGLTVNPSNELVIPSSVTVPAGQTQVVFTVQANDDNRIDGNLSVNVTASAPGITPASGQTITVDNETRTLSLVLPTTVQEGSAAIGTVIISGTLNSPLEVDLASSATGTLTVPAKVTIEAGETSATFSLNAVDNNLRDGSRPVLISAQASSFTSGADSIIVRDNEVATYRFSSLTDIVNVTAPVPVTVVAADIEGNPISGFSGNVNLSLVLPDGGVQPVAPGAVSLGGANGWSGDITVPVVTTPPLRLRASDANGNSGDSTPFDIMRVLALTTSDLVWDASRNRIYASVAPSAPSYANQVVSVNPGNLQVVGNVAVNQDPRKLVLTSGNEALYVALDANGTVAKINPATMAVSLSFAVGVSQYYGTLYAEDMCAVAGQPNLVVVSQYRKNVSPRHNGVAVYDNGTIRPNKTQDHTGSNRIEPSADPTLFFGYNNETTEFGFRQLLLDANGMTQTVVNTSLFGGFSSDIFSDGNMVWSSDGVEIDGLNMRRLGAFAVTSPGATRPDLAANRVYFVESTYQFSYQYNTLSAYDPATFSRIRALSLPTWFDSVGSLVRWGANGLAFRTSDSLVLINSSQLVPSNPPADLAVSVQATPNPASVGNPLTYTVQLTNQGPNISHNTILSATLSDSQAVGSATPSIGTAFINGSIITVPVGDIAVGGSATLTVTTSPQSAGGLSCTAGANSSSIDPNFANNIAFKFVSVGFESVADRVNQLRLPANNIIYDPLRNLIWATIPNTVDPPLGRSIVSIDPKTGLVSDPFPMKANPFENSIALSGNGRYLYVGLTDSPEVIRVDLTTSPYTSVRIPLGLSQWGDNNYAEDIEVLDGDGTSFIIAGADDHSAAVYDGSVRRTNRSGIYTVDRVERTATAGTFVGYDNYSSGFEVSRLPVTASGVTISQSNSSVISGYYADISGSADLLLSSTGKLVDSSSLTLKSSFGIAGRPCADAANGRAYLVNGNTLRAFDTSSAAALGSLALPVIATGDWAGSLIRWGLDGFAIAGGDGNVYIARWSSAIPSDKDSNNDFVSDQWEATYFGTFNVSPGADPDRDGIANAWEYLFGTSPTQSNGSPVQTTRKIDNGQANIHLVFPRRAGLAPQTYGYETSTNLQQWNPASGVIETVVATQTLNGIQFDTIDAAIPAPLPNVGFARLKWRP